LKGGEAVARGAAAERAISHGAADGTIAVKEYARDTGFF